MARRSNQFEATAARRFRLLARLALAAVVLRLAQPASVAAAARVTGLESLQIVQRLTGPTFTGHVSIGGTDLGHMVNHNDATYFLFGDTFSGETPAAGGLWRSNVMAYTHDKNAADGIAFEGWITNASGQAREVIHSGWGAPITEIPTGAISVNGRIYAWYMAVNWWGPPGEWTNSYAGLASWQEGEQQFTIHANVAFPGTSNFGMVAASLRDDLTDGSDPHVYLWGTPAGRLGGVKLARVAPLEIENLAAYEYFGGMAGGAPTWVASESSAPLIVPPTVGEMSVVYNPGLASWTMLSLNHNAYAIELRQAPAPWGPWSEPVTVVRGQQYAGLYGSYMNPLYLADGGKTMYFTMSLWEPYDVYLVRAKLTTAPEFAADFDGDGDVDAKDLSDWRGGFGTASGATVTQGDADRNGVVDGHDFLAWQRQVGSGALTAAVPEPGGAALWAALGLAVRGASTRSKFRG